MIQIISYILCFFGIASIVCYCWHYNNLDTNCCESNNLPDEQDFKSRYVKPILKFIEDEKKTAVTQSLNICITGKWGVGKSFLMRQLKAELSQNKNNIIVEIDPLIEGKFEVQDLMLNFYKKLKQKLAGRLFNFISKYKVLILIFFILIGALTLYVFKTIPNAIKPRGQVFE